MDEAETTVSGLAQEPDEVGECAVISRKRLEQSLTAADFQQVGVSKSERARLIDTYFCTMWVGWQQHWLIVSSTV